MTWERWNVESTTGANVEFGEVCARWVFALRALRAQEGSDTSRIGGPRGCSGRLTVFWLSWGAFRAPISAMW